MPRFVRSFLAYELGSRLCDEYSVMWPAKKEATRMQLWRRLISYGEVDLSPEVENEYSRVSAGKASWPLFYYVSGGGQ